MSSKARNEAAQERARTIKIPVSTLTSSEKSRYSALEWDYKNNSLPDWKREEFLALRKKIEGR